MSFLSRLFKSGTDDKGSSDVDARLARLEREAEQALPGYVGSAYNRAGDVALRSGRSEQAVDYYGRAINAFLEDMQREAARGVANKIIRVRPDALRTLCTLTWLDLAAKHEATALLHLRDYVGGAKERGEHARAATQIWAMAHISPFEEFVGAVADALDGLDYPKRAREVRSWVSTGSPGLIEDPDALGDACLRAAIESNQSGTELLSDDAAAVPDDADVDVKHDESEAREADASADEVGDPAPEGEATDEGGPADGGQNEAEEEAREEAESGEPAEADALVEEPAEVKSSNKKRKKSKKKRKKKRRG